MWEIETREKVYGQLKSSWEICDFVEKGGRMAVPEDSPLYVLINRCWDSNPEKRPTFSQIYEFLDLIKMADESPSETGSINTPSNEEIPIENLAIQLGATPEETILKSFADETSISWNVFVHTLQKATNVTVKVVEKMKYLLAENEMVAKKTWCDFLEWFTPLCQSDNYETSTSKVVENGWSIEEISEVVGANFFFGFISAEQAKSILSNKPYGAYLFRFSSNPGCYALTVNYGAIGHWRITAEKYGTAPPIFKIDGRPYKNLYDIVDVHRVGGEPLSIKGSTQKSCFLKAEVDRNEIFGLRFGEKLYEDGIL